MVFSSLLFIYGFLPLCLLFYFFAGRQSTKNIVLLIFSLLFYAWGEPVWVILMILTGSLIYWAGKKIDQNRTDKPKAKLFLALTIIIALTSLAVFKYSGFVISNINLIPGIQIRQPQFTLPIGISFYTFQSLTYAIDLYRGKAEVQRSLKNFLLYVSLFPQLIAGPIVRYTDISEQIDNRAVTVEDFSSGVSRFLTGLAKKVLIANHAGEIVAQTLETRLAQLSAVEAWIGLLAFSLQIYFDFSGYSDMAIGLGRMFGFKFLENFNYPYIAASITDFWRRWHISLSTFFRDYVYIPLGGNRSKQIRNMFIVWSLTGLWHGASWNFVFWGIYFFLFLALEKIFLLGILEKLHKSAGHIYTLLVVFFGWIFFYFQNTSDLISMFKAMFAIKDYSFYNVRAEILISNEIVFLAAAIILATPLVKNLYKKTAGLMADSRKQPVMAALLSAVHLLILIISTASLAGSSFNPFLYFRF
jgi:alginate O-acetyltransferase complex protein AlgI